MLHKKYKVFIATDSLKETKKIDTFIKTNINDKLKGKNYNSETSDDEMNEIVNCNKIWSKLDYVIVSPSVLYGTSFDPIIPHFDVAFGFYKGVIPARSIHQQLRRVRALKQKEIYINITCISMKEFYNIKGYKFLSADQLRAYIETDNVIKNKMVTINYKYDENDAYVHDMCDLNTNLFITCYSEEIKAKQNMALELINYVTEYGAKAFYLEVDRICTNDYNSIMRDIGNKITKLDYEDYISSVEIARNYDQIEKIAKSSIKTTDDKKALVAYKIMKECGLKNLNIPFLEYLGDVSRTEIFKYSRFLFMDDREIDVELNKTYKDEYKINIEPYKQKILLTGELMNIFFEEGIIDPSRVIVSNKHANFTDKQKTFIKQRGMLLGVLFQCIKRYVNKFIKKPKGTVFDKKEPSTKYSKINHLEQICTNQYILAKLLNHMLKDCVGAKMIFGRPSLPEMKTTLKNPDLKQKSYKTFSKQLLMKIDEVSVYFYAIELNQMKYLEIMLVSNMELFKGKTNKLEWLRKNECVFTDLHGYETFGKILDKINNRTFNLDIFDDSKETDDADENDCDSEESEQY
jgi:hypothetical protein